MVTLREMDNSHKEGWLFDRGKNNRKPLIGNLFTVHLMGWPFKRPYSGSHLVGGHTRDLTVNGLLQGCAALQGLLFTSLTLEQAIKFTLTLWMTTVFWNWNRVPDYLCWWCSHQTLVSIFAFESLHFFHVSDRIPILAIFVWNMVNISFCSPSYFVSDKCFIHITIFYMK